MKTIKVSDLVHQELHRKMLKHDSVDDIIRRLLEEDAKPKVDLDFVYSKIKIIVRNELRDIMNNMKLITQDGYGDEL